MWLSPVTGQAQWPGRDNGLAAAAKASLGSTGSAAEAAVVLVDEVVEQAGNDTGKQIKSCRQWSVQCQWHIVVAVVELSSVDTGHVCHVVSSSIEWVVVLPIDFDFKLNWMKWVCASN